MIGWLAGYADAPTMLDGSPEFEDPTWPELMPQLWCWPLADDMELVGKSPAELRPSGSTDPVWWSVNPAMDPIPPIDAMVAEDINWN